MKQKYVQLNNKGFALLYTVLIVSILSLVMGNVFNLAKKETVLSVAGNESLASWYAADSATECALFAFYKNVPTGSVFCNGDTLPVVQNSSGQDTFYARTSPLNSGKNMTCAQVIMRKNVSILSGVDEILVNEIVARGFSSCDEYSGTGMLFRPRAEDPYLTERRIRVRYAPE
jgi:hypothetical protein